MGSNDSYWTPAIQPETEWTHEFNINESKSHEVLVYARNNYGLVSDPIGIVIGLDDTYPANLPIARDLSAYWEFENSSALGNDSSAKGNHLSISSSGNTIQQSSGKVGMAVDFNRDWSFFLNETETEDFQIGSADFSISLWIKPDFYSMQGFPEISNPQQNGRIIHFGSGGSATEGFMLFLTSVHSLNSQTLVKRLSLSTTDGSFLEKTSSGDNALVDDAWQHVVAVVKRTNVNGANGMEAQLYINGEPAGSTQSNLSGDIRNISDDFFMGTKSSFVPLTADAFDGVFVNQIEAEQLYADLQEDSQVNSPEDDKYLDSNGLLLNTFETHWAMHGLNEENGHYVGGTQLLLSSSYTDEQRDEIYLVLRSYLNAAFRNSSFTGQMDQVGIWRRALTTSEIETLYNSGNGIAFAEISSNTAPTVSITAPISGSVVSEGTSSIFSGTAYDTEDGEISTNLIWNSNLDGQIGTGNLFPSGSLSTGIHTITASAMDSSGATGSEGVTLTVENPLGPVPVGHWSFNGNYNDTVGSEDGLPQNGAALISGGMDGDAVELSTLGDHVDLGDVNAFDPNSGSLSYSAWFNTTGTGVHAIISFNGGTGWHSAGLYEMRVTYGKLQTRCISDASSTELVITGTAVVNDGEWHHGVLSFDYPSRTVELFVDGVSQGTQTADAWAAPDDQINRRLTLGVTHYNTEDRDLFTGLIDEVSVYDSVLTSTEINVLFGTPTLPTPIGHWSFNGNYNDTVGSEDGLPQNGAALVPGGLDGDAVELWTLGEHVDLGDVNAFDPNTGSLSYSTWFNTTGAGVHAIITFNGGTGWHSAGLFEMRVAYGKLQTRCISDASSSELVITSFTVVNDGGWHHGVLTFDYPSKTVELFIDGVSEGTQTADAWQAPNDQVNRRLVLGVTHYNTEDRDLFTGLIDEVSIYDTVLTPAEISILFNKNSP